MTIQYDGTDFCGSQFQPRQRTVQEELNKAIELGIGERVNLIFSGRTDSGVHAMAQVVNFHTESKIPADKIFYPIRKFLPNDLYILKSEEVPLEFNSRFDAKYRTYRYFIRKNSDLFKNRFRLVYPFDLDVNKLDLAAQNLLGEHDFQAFCSAHAEVKHHRCTIQRIRFYQDNDDVIFEVTANRFLHNMIRILVSVFLNINCDKLSVHSMMKLLADKDRRMVPKTISPEGLFLWEIGY
jgi:tRNA pseudouridine38-40 synthase